MTDCSAVGVAHMYFGSHAYGDITLRGESENAGCRSCKHPAFAYRVSRRPTHPACHVNFERKFSWILLICKVNGSSTTVTFVLVKWSVQHHMPHVYSCVSTFLGLLSFALAKCTCDMLS